ncbi:MAG: restriction endonuclease [Sulfurovum sp. PC08-66]|nr:MAG: restriction endonuclease [Sulfurovum sp. PC08-66]
MNNQEYWIVDSIQNLRAEDSFIHRNNKLELFKGNGEARKYVGSYKGEKGKALSRFFEYDNWGNTKENDGKRLYLPISTHCFFSKTNLLKYLYDARVEYTQQEQIYKNDIALYYNEYFETIATLKDNLLPFSIYDVSDFIDNEKNSHRAYIRSDDAIWKQWRRLLLPKISYLSILKLMPVATNNTKPLFYFRVFLDYQFRSIVHSKAFNEPYYTIEHESKKERRATPSREGSQKYRKQVLEYMPQCPFTKISDERLLIASHIKPYKVCIDENKEDEALDYLNGLSLSPTYDKLFDQGYLTFANDGKMICGTQLSILTWERLNINPNAKNIMRIYPQKREKYLEYHQKYVFLDDIHSFI